MARYWTEDEIGYLHDNCGIISNQKLAAILHRTPHAIRNKLHKMGVSVFDNFYTARLLGEELGRNHCTVMQWYRKRWLRGKTADWGRGFLNRAMIFLERDIVKFLKKKHHLFKDTVIPNPYFCNIVKRLQAEKT